MFDIRQTKAEIIEAASIQNDKLVMAYSDISALLEEIERLRKERDEWQHKWMAMAQASLLAGTMRLGDQ